MCGRDRRHLGIRRTGNHQLLEASEEYTGWSCRDTRGTSSSGLADNTETWRDTKEKILQIAPAELWKMQKILSSKTGSSSQTYKNNTEAKTKVIDLNQRTMQALNTVAVVYATFEQAGAKT